MGVDFSSSLRKASWELERLTVCIDGFTKSVKLYAITGPTTKAVPLKKYYISLRMKSEECTEWPGYAI